MKMKEEAAIAERRRQAYEKYVEEQRKQQEQQIISEKRSVTAILVLNCLPYALLSSILAHESMHAWIKLNTLFLNSKN